MFTKQGCFETNSYRHGREQEIVWYDLWLPQTTGSSMQNTQPFMRFFFIPFSHTGISRWECMRQGTVKKFCGQSNSANAESKVTATFLGDSSDYFLLRIRYSATSQTALELPSLHLPLHRKHG